MICCGRRRQESGRDDECDRCDRGSADVLHGVASNGLTRPSRRGRWANTRYQARWSRSRLRRSHGATRSRRTSDRRTKAKPSARGVGRRAGSVRLGRPPGGSRMARRRRSAADLASGRFAEAVRSAHAARSGPPDGWLASNCAVEIYELCRQTQVDVRRLRSEVSWLKAAVIDIARDGTRLAASTIEGWLSIWDLTTQRGRSVCGGPRRWRSTGAPPIWSLT